ncbi:52 kDa protein [Southern Psittacara leucophthalmus aviadenovirus]|uniref:52 kDa protein n=1 Tax=Southern Psittacara leucophthalmus aviadenovirus TaxID=2604330 RepID=A0AAE6IRJ7_9ADEN|nr:52 kDa protein [Southern Psittacara leucophthalmus aviadenovirus]QEJ80769.1 52 kDa protein [Southern Psittacara leucophthalmus aviadenovirus]
MHPVLQSVQNATGNGYQQSRRSHTGAMRPPSPPRYPAQHALPAGPSNAQPQDDYLTEPPVCGIAAGANMDQTRMRERDVTRRANVPENNLFKDPRDKTPQNDYERDIMYKSGQMLDIDPNRVLEPSDFAHADGDPTFSPAINHIKAAELKRSADQTAFNEELRNSCHQTRLRTALLRPELAAGLYYIHDFVQTYVEHPDGRVKLSPQLALVAMHAGKSILAKRLWAIAEDRNAWLRDLIEMAYMIVTDHNMNCEQRLSAICTTVVELSMKYAKLTSKYGYPSMAQMAKAQEFFYRVMEAILDLGVQVGVYNNRPVQYRQKTFSDLHQMTDADYMFGLTQALENRPPQSEFESGEFESDYEDAEDDYY